MLRGARLATSAARHKAAVGADEVERLYGLPLEEFTKERNALAARLKKEGETERAEEVRALPKPTAAAWAVNQLARRNEVQVRGLLRAGERLRQAQEGALAGEGGDALREATREERDVVQRLVSEAKNVMPKASQSMLDRVATTLRAAAVDERARELLKHGMLTREVASSGGFDLLAGMPVAPAKARGEQRDDGAAERKRQVAATRARVTALRAEARERDREARAAEKDAEALRAAADETASALTAAEDELRRLT
jgi:hypothetical protein